jgi:hypothetical protein
MSLRELARAHLGEIEASPSQALTGKCPASGHIGVSGPDKPALSESNQWFDCVRTGNAIRTAFPPDKSDSLDASDRSDTPDKRGAGEVAVRAAPRLIHRCERCNAVASFGVGCFPTKGVRGRWYCVSCLPAARESALSRPLRRITWNARFRARVSSM